MLPVILMAACCAGPAEQLRAAVADVEARVAVRDRATTRYITLCAVDPQRRGEARSVVSFVLNSVSRSSRLVQPAIVPGSDGDLLRVDVAQLAPRDKDVREWLATWEAMIADDPYFHLKTQVIDPNTNKQRTVVTDGGWVNLADAARLRTACQSVGALVRADWLIAQLTTPPRYYQFAGIAARKADWLKSLGLDAATIVRLEATRGANLFRSGVTDKPRRLSRWTGPLGALWNTYDTNGRDPTKDVFRDPSFQVRFDAGEHIAVRANGLLEYALFNAEGVRQDEVPSDIALDDTVSPPVPLVPMLSCVRCHGIATEDGLRSFVDDQSRLLAGHVELLGQDRSVLNSLESFYGRQQRLERELKRDREDYRSAVAAVTGGMTPSEVVTSLDLIYDAYAARSVTLEVAAREVGLDARDFRDRLTNSHDPVLLALVAGLDVQRSQWEASYAEAALLAATPMPHEQR